MIFDYAGSAQQALSKAITASIFSCVGTALSAIASMDVIATPFAAYHFSEVLLTIIEPHA